MKSESTERRRRHEHTGRATDRRSTQIPGNSRRFVGLAAAVFPGLYVSDLIELAQGGFSTPQLVLTLAAEAAVPFLVIGLYLLQRPRIGNLASSKRSPKRTRLSSSPAQLCTRSRTQPAIGISSSISSGRG